MSERMKTAHAQDPSVQAWTIHINDASAVCMLCWENDRETLKLETKQMVVINQNAHSSIYYSGTLNQTVSLWTMATFRLIMEVRLDIYNNRKYIG